MFAVLVAGFAAASEALIRTRVEPHHNYFRYLALFRDARVPDAIFGDSVAAYGLTGMSGTVNLAQGGDSMAGISAKIRAYFGDRPAGRVIVQVSPRHFSQSYLHWRPADDDFLDLLHGFGPYTPRITAGPAPAELFGYWRIFLSGGEFQPLQAFRPDGSRPVPPSSRFANMDPAVKHRGAVRFAYQIRPVADPASTDVAALYRDTINFLKDRGAIICMVDMPVSRVLKEAAAEIGRFRATKAFLASMARDFGVRYVDGWSLDLPDTMFADYNHLNSAGAEAATPRIASACFGDPSSP